jgi:two-component system cell cycle sensor histidine kinase/response regulator CckA
MPPSPGTETILVVDDERLVLSLTHAMLSRYGYTVLSAINGAEALALFKNWPDIEVDLLLVDLVMPGISGPETVKQIQELRPGVPVLYFSAYSEMESLRPQYARGIPYIAKPFTSIQLMAKIREALDSRPSADAASAT